MKHLMLITTSLVLLLVLAGCRTSDKSKTDGFVYSIKNAEVRGNFLNFTLKNHNNRSLRKATVYVQLGIQNQESDFSEIPAIEKTFECNLNHLEKTDFSICLSEYALTIISSGMINMETGVSGKKTVQLFIFFFVVFFTNCNTADFSTDCLWKFL